MSGNNVNEKVCLMWKSIAGKVSGKTGDRNGRFPLNLFLFFCSQQAPPSGCVEMCCPTLLIFPSADGMADICGKAVPPSCHHVGPRCHVRYCAATTAGPRSSVHIVLPPNSNNCSDVVSVYNCKRNFMWAFLAGVRKHIGKRKHFWSIM